MIDVGSCNRKADIVDDAIINVNSLISKYEEAIFYIDRNESTHADSLVKKLNGELDDYIDITIVSDGKVISKGNIGAQTRAASVSVDPSLAPGERRAFKMVFHMSEVAKNRIKNKYVEFDFCAGATQVKNNPQRQF